MIILNIFGEEELVINIQCSYAYIISSLFLQTRIAARNSHNSLLPPYWSPGRFVTRCVYAMQGDCNTPRLTDTKEMDARKSQFTVTLHTLPWHMGHWPKILIFTITVLIHTHKGLIYHGQCWLNIQYIKIELLENFEIKTKLYTKI